MKPGIHPDYRPVVFHDTSVDEYFVVGSTLKPIAPLSGKTENIPVLHIGCVVVFSSVLQVSNAWFKRKGVLLTSTVVLVNLLVRRNKS